MREWTYRQFPGLILMVFLLAAAPAAAQTPPRTARDGVYTAAQAARGNATFADVCASCHAPAQFTGVLLASWEGRTLHDVWERIRTTMPYDAPGRLTAQQYADVLAYLLSLDGFPPGAAELKGDTTLKAIRIEPKPPEK